MHDGTWARRIMYQSFYVSRTKLSRYQHAVQTPPYQFQKFHKVAKISKSHPSNIRHMRNQSTLEFQELLYTIMFQLFAWVEMYIEHQCTINVVHKYLFESIKSCEHTGWERQNTTLDAGGSLASQSSPRRFLEGFQAPAKVPSSDGCSTRPSPMNPRLAKN